MPFPTVLILGIVVALWGIVCTHFLLSVVCPLFVLFCFGFFVFGFLGFFVCFFNILFYNYVFTSPSVGVDDLQFRWSWPFESFVLCNYVY